MKKAIKVFGILTLMIFSFYYTEKVALYAQDNTALKKEILTFKENNKVPSVNAKIDGDYIVPGLDGLEINVNKSYDNMKLRNVFNENELVYNVIHPNISINKYPDKIIISGNLYKKAVSIIINDNALETISYFNNNNIKYYKLDRNEFCILIDNNCSNILRKVKPSIILNNNNFLRNIDLIKNGDIVYIEEELLEKYLYVLIKQINYTNLQILDLNDHLSENNNI